MELRMSRYSLPAPSRKRKVYQSKDAPFPVPIESITQVPASNDRWQHYTGFLRGDQVLVYHSGDIDYLYSKGFFGKGSLSERAPEFNARQPRAISKRRYVHRLAWKKSAQALQSREASKANVLLTEGLAEYRTQCEEAIEARIQAESSPDEAVCKPGSPSPDQQVMKHLPSWDEEVDGSPVAPGQVESGRGDSTADAGTADGTTWDHDTSEQEAAAEQFWSSGTPGVTPNDEPVPDWPEDVDNTFWGSQDSDDPSRVRMDSLCWEESDNGNTWSQETPAGQSGVENSQTSTGGSRLGVNSDAWLSHSVAGPLQQHNAPEAPSNSQSTDGGASSSNLAEAPSSSRQGGYESGSSQAQPSGCGESHVTDVQGSDICSKGTNKKIRRAPPTTPGILGGTGEDDTQTADVESELSGHHGIARDTHDTGGGMDEPTGSQRQDVLESGQKDMLGSEQQDIVESEQQDMLGSGQQDIVESGQKDMVGSGQQDMLGSGQQDILGSGQQDMLGSGQQDMLGSGQQDMLGSGQQDSSLVSEEQDKSHMDISQEEPDDEQKVDPCCHGNDADGELLVMEDSGDEQDLPPGVLAWKLCRKREPHALREHLVLRLEEAFFLSFGLGCLLVYDEHQKKLDLCDMWRTYSSICRSFIPSYVAYHYYRSKGWVPTGGLKFGADYLLYKEGPAFYHASFMVMVQPLNSDLTTAAQWGFQRLSWTSLARMYRVAEQVSKDLMLCSVIFPPEGVDLRDPGCISKFKVKETVLKRWVPSQEREAKTSS